jgi:hypothetical protein
LCTDGGIEVKKFSIVAFFLASMVSAPISAEAACHQCDEMKSLLDHTDLLKARRFLSDFSFTKDRSQKSEQAKLVTDLALKYAPKDDEGDVDEFYYDLFSEEPHAMEEALGGFSPKQQKYLRGIYHQMRKVRECGNGGCAK